MSYQVGAACYATTVEAGGAACSSFDPIRALTPDGSAVRTVSCTSVDPSSGALNLQVISTPIDGGASVVSMVVQSPTYPTCTQADYVAAAEVVAASLLGCWAVVYGLNAVRRYIDWSRGDV